MRYKFSLAPKIKGYVEWQLEHYHEDKRQIAECRESMLPSCTASYSGMLGGGGPSDPTRKAVERMVSNQYINTTERNVRAVETVLNQCDETSRKLVELVYWKRKYSVVGAGDVVGLKQNGAYKRINRVLCHLALEMGLVSP